MRLVERMTMAPHRCIYCGKGHAPDEHGAVGPFLDLERDVNWGDAAYLCMNCVSLVAATCGFFSEEDVSDLNRENTALEKRLQNANSRAEILGRQRQELQNRLGQITGGVAALREEKKKAKRREEASV